MADPALQPFHIEGPTIISFSGGRTSGYMLWRILQAHGGTLPAETQVCFANTGREMPGTLDFVNECATRWGVRVVWLEYRREPPTPEQATAWRAARIARLEARLEKARSPKVMAKLRRHIADTARMAAPGREWSEEVSHNRASRQGEPFRMMLAAKQMLPNPVMRFCTEELKIRTVRRWVRATQDWSHWRNAVGLRADEEHRVVRMRARNAEGKERFTGFSPLFDAGVTSEHVMAFWAAQPFDLRLAGKWEGNCDGCFLKRQTAIARMFRDHPKRMEWWSNMEEEAASKAVRDPTVALFRKDRPRYSAIRDLEFDQSRLELDADDNGIDTLFAGSCMGECGV